MTIRSFPVIPTPTPLSPLRRNIEARDKGAFGAGVVTVQERIMVCKEPVVSAIKWGDW